MLKANSLNCETFQIKMVEEFKGVFLEHNDNGDVSPIILWDAAKAFIRGKVIAHTALQNKLKKKTA